MTVVRVAMLIRHRQSLNQGEKNIRLTRKALDEMYPGQERHSLSKGLKRLVDAGLIKVESRDKASVTVSVIEIPWNPKPYPHNEIKVVRTTKSAGAIDWQSLAL